MAGQNEAFTRVLIDKALEASGWNLLDSQQVHFELNNPSGRSDYLLKDRLGRTLCVLEAKREDLDPYDAKEQARGYAENLNAAFVLLSNGREHWFWNYQRADQRDAYRIERLPSREDLERLRLKNLQPPRPLQTAVIRPEYLNHLRPDLTPRGYQIPAMDEIAKGYDETGHRKFLLEMATGTGKTLLCAALIRRFLVTRNAERVLFIVDRIELAKQTMEDFNVVLGEYKPVIYKTARRTGELLGSSVVVATIQSLMTDRRYRSVDMLSTGYNCRDLLNVVLMRPIFSPTEYIQIKGRGTRRFTFVVGNTEYEKKHFFLLDFCAVAEYFEEKYDYAAPLKVPQQDGRRGAPARYEPGEGGSVVREPGAIYGPDEDGEGRCEIPVWEGTDRIVSQEIRIVGPNGEKVDVMTFRSSFERDLKEFADADPDLQSAVESEDDDAIETILQERFYHHPEMFYAPDKLIISYGVPAPTPAFVYNALGKRPLPTKDKVVADTVDSIAARFNLRYGDQKWLNATAELVSDDPQALSDFLAGRYNRLFERSQFRTLGGLPALSRFAERDQVFEALRQSSLVECSRHALRPAG